MNQNELKKLVFHEYEYLEGDLTYSIKTILRIYKFAVDESNIKNSIKYFIEEFENRNK